MDEEMNQDEYIKMLEDQYSELLELVDYLKFCYKPSRTDRSYVHNTYESIQKRRFPLAKFKMRRLVNNGK